MVTFRKNATATTITTTTTTTTAATTTTTTTAAAAAAAAASTTSTIGTMCLHLVARLVCKAALPEALRQEKVDKVEEALKAASEAIDVAERIAFDKALGEYAGAVLKLAAWNL